MKHGVFKIHLVYFSYCSLIEVKYRPKLFVFVVMVTFQHTDIDCIDLDMSQDNQPMQPGCIIKKIYIYISHNLVRFFYF